MSSHTSLCTHHRRALVRVGAFLMVATVVTGLAGPARAQGTASNTQQTRAQRGASAVKPPQPARPKLATPSPAQRRAVAKAADPTLRKGKRRIAARPDASSTPRGMTAHGPRSAPAPTGAAPGEAGTLAASAAASDLVFSSVSTSDDLNCTATVDAFVEHPSVFYGGNACATFLTVDGTGYGPASIPAGPSMTPWTPVSQTVTGDGSSANPTVITTVVDAGTTGVRLIQKDTHVASEAAWGTSATIQNPNHLTVSRLSHARDCYVANSDLGTGQAVTSFGATFCQGDSAALGLVSKSPGASWVEGYFGAVWGLATSGEGLPNTHESAVVDNGQAVSWQLDPTVDVQTRAWVSVLVAGPSAETAGSSPNPSVSPTTCSSGQPVNCATGDFWHTFDDVAVPARGLPLGFSRTYDLARSSTNGRLGHGWHDSLDMRLTTVDNATDVVQENGSTVTFQRQDDGSWSAGTQVLADLTQAVDGTWTFTRRESGLSYVFATSGRLTTIRSSAGESLVLSYSTGGLLTQVSSGGAGRITFAWTGSRITSVTDPVGRTTTFRYDAAGDLVATTGSGEAQWTFGYDAAHHMLSMTDPLGHVTANTFDAAFRVVAQRQPSGGTISYEYAGDPATIDGGTTVTVDERGIRTEYLFRSMLLLGRTVSGGNALSRVTEYTYDLVTLRLVAVADDGLVRRTGYDTLGRIVTNTDARGRTSSFEYAGESYRRTATVTPSGLRSTAEYDDRGRLTSSTEASGVTAGFTYGDSAHPADVTSSATGDRITTIRRDALGNVVHSEVTSSAGTVVLQHGVFDAAGRPICQVPPAQYASSVRCAAPGTHAAGTTTMTYDAAGNMISTTGPTGATTTYTFDVGGHRIGATDALGRRSSFAYDALGRGTSVTRAMGTPQATTSTTRYDVPAGDSGCPAQGATLFCVIQSDGRRTTAEGYDPSGDLVSVVRPGSGTRVFTRSAGLVQTQVMEDGSEVSYSYDGDRLTGLSYSDETTSAVSYLLDDDGQRAVMYDDVGTSSYEYDAGGRLVAQTTPAGTVRASYNRSGEVAEITYPDGNVVLREYDAAGRLVAVLDWGGRRSTFTLDDDGAVRSASLPNGRTIESTYDERGGLLRRSVPNTPISLAKTRDASGRVMSITQTGLPGAATQTATYDALGQLASVGGVATSSDLAGSPVALDGVTQAFDPALQLVSQTGGGTTTSFTSSPRGERLQRNEPNGSRTWYAYDQESRLTGLWSVAGPRVTRLDVTSGTSAGGNTMTVTGSGFLPGAQVWFGSRAAVTTVVSATTLTAVVPAGSGAVDVTVTTRVGRSTTLSAARYTYQRPTISRLSTTWGLATGGQPLSVYGFNFAGTTSVKVGTLAATFSVISPEQINLTTPAGSGIRDIVVTTAQGASIVGTQTKFTYRAEPIVQSISPQAGRSVGGTTVTLRGYNLIGLTAVRFGTKTATGVRVVSSTSATAIAPSGSSSVHVTATSAKGTSATSAGSLFAYGAGPLVTAVSPRMAPAKGGTTISVTGYGFTSTTAVTVGGRAVSRTIVSSTSLRFVMPAGTGTAAVQVANGTVRSPLVAADVITYLQPAVTRVAFASGPIDGNQRVTISGSRFTAATQVLFGTTPGMALTVSSSTSLWVTTPAGTGTVDVRVVTPEGTSAVVPADRYTFTTSPILTGVSPAVLRAQGDDTVTLTGWNLDNLTEVAFGGVRVSVGSATADTALIRAPAGSGVVGVTGYAGETAAAATTSLQVVYSGVDERYRYDGDGRRYSTTTPAGTSTALWDPFAQKPALLVSGSTRLVQGPGDLPITQVDGAGNALTYLHDELGTTFALLDDSGTVAATFAYSPYGRVTGRTGTISPVVSYAGGFQDNTGLVYLVNRYLDPTTGTFLTVDPAMQFTGQPYAYAAGDPLNAVDREGQWPTIAIGAVIGAAVGAVAATVSYAAATNDFSWRELAGAAAGGVVSGAITGACMGTGVGLVAATACGAAGGAFGSIVNQSISQGSIDAGRIALDTGLGALGGYAGGWLSAGMGLEVSRRALSATTARWGGLQASNLWRPGAITTKFYGSTIVGAIVGWNINAAELAGTDLYRYLRCAF